MHKVRHNTQTLNSSAASEVTNRCQDTVSQYLSKSFLDKISRSSLSFTAMRTMWSGPFALCILSPLAFSTNSGIKQNHHSDRTDGNGDIKCKTIDDDLSVQDSIMMRQSTEAEYGLVEVPWSRMDTVESHCSHTSHENSFGNSLGIGIKRQGTPFSSSDDNLNPLRSEGISLYRQGTPFCSHEDEMDLEPGMASVMRQQTPFAKGLVGVTEIPADVD